MEIRTFCVLLLLLTASSVHRTNAQLSNPITKDEHAHDPNNKFIQRTTSPDTEGLTPLDEELKANTQCPSGVELRWQTEVASSIYATPLIADMNMDGKNEIIVPSFVHYLEVLEGADGEKLPGWPVYHKSSAHTSPLLYDIDHDGLQEVLLASYNGEILVFSHYGDMMDDYKLVLPRLKVKKDWYVGLEGGDPVDHRNPDIHASILEDELPPEEVEDAARLSDIPDQLLNLPHRDDLNQAHGGAGGAADSTKDKHHKVDEPKMPDHLPNEPEIASKANATANAAQAANATIPMPKILPTEVPAGAAVNSSQATSGANLTTHVATGGTDALHDAKLPETGTAHAAAGQGEVHLEKAKTGERNAHQEGTSGQGSTDHPAANQGTHTTTAADHSATQQPQSGQVAADAGHTGQASAGGIKPEHVGLTAEQRTLSESWEKWHSDLVAKNVPLTPEQQQKWDQFVTWRTDKAAEQQAPGHAATRRRLLQAGGGDHGVNNHAQRKPATDDQEEATVEPGPELEEEGAASWDVFKDVDEGMDEGLRDEYHYDYDEDYKMQEDLWADEDWTETDHDKYADSVDIDAHILCTPVIGDIDNNGEDELVVAASFFFDREYYDDPAHKDELEEGIDISKYIAGAVIAFNLKTREVKWFQQLDMTTEGTQFRAYIYSQPTIIDLDRDGFMEIVVGTSVGFVYVLEHDGRQRTGWPLQMGEVQGQVTVADVNDDGHLEIVGVDTKGNVAVWNIHATELWERHTKSLIAQGATIGDVDGDGNSEVVVTTTSGHIWVFNGRTGEDHGAFPFRAHGRIMVPALLVDLNKEKKRGGLHIVVISFDGYLYVINGETGCADTIDVGETSYSMVLADQVDGGDDLDLIVSTMNGNVYCFSTPAPYHPLKAWPSLNQGMNVFSSRSNHEGIYVLPQYRQFRDIGSESVSVQYEIVDKRTPAVDLATGNKNLRGPYHVTIWLHMHGHSDIIEKRTCERPGIYTVRVKCPSYRSFAQLTFEMVDEHKAHFFDEFTLSFHMFSHRILKWVLVLPLLAMLAALVVRRPPDSLDVRESLPSFRGNRYLP